jgi:transposase-like protein
LLIIGVLLIGCIIVAINSPGRLEPLKDSNGTKQMLNIGLLIDETKCYEMIRKLRWESGVRCVKCSNWNVKKNGVEKDGRQNYSCNNCGKYFDDVTNTIFSGHHQSVKIWVLCLYFMGLNLSNLQIAKELDLCESDVQAMTTQLREGIEKKAEEEPVVLGGSVEMDEVYITAGHKGNPASVKKNSEAGEETV